MWAEAQDLLDQVLREVPDHAEALQLRKALSSDLMPSSGHGRRFLTVLFADLAGSTELSAAVSDEEYIQIIGAYRRVVRTAVTNARGHVDQFQGDGVVVYFGFPTSAEDDQARAVMAACDIVTGTARAGEDLGRSLAARVGIHVGQTLMTDTHLGLRDQDAAIGFSANVAARIQATVGAGEVAVSSAVVPFIQDEFALEVVRDATMKGIPSEIGVHRVVARLEHGRDDTGSRATPLIGRDALAEQLTAAWESSARGNEPGAVVVLRGEGGIGKSRLVRQVNDRARRDDATVVTVNCARSLRHVGLGAVCRGIEEVLTPAGSDPEQTRKELHERLGFVGLPAQSFTILAWLLGVEDPNDGQGEMSPDRRREAVLDTLMRWLSAEASQAPMLVVIEDLDLADETTLELVTRLARDGAPAGSMVVVTMRADEVPPSLATDALTVIPVEPLDGESARALVAAVGGDGLDEALVQQLADRSDGVPLFAEQLALTARNGVAGDDPPQVPATLEQLLQIRLDATGSGRPVAELASVIGREFSHRVLQLTHAAISEPGIRLNDGLDALRRADLIEETEPGTFRFRHALVHDVAYRLQLSSSLGERHRAVAGAISACDGDRAAPETLAFHYTAGGDHRRAASAHLKAADRATLLAEWSRATDALSKARAGIEALRDAGESDAALDRLELACCLRIGGIGAVSESYVHAGAESAYARALELCDDLAGDEDSAGVLDGQVFVALGGLWSKEIVAGRLDAAGRITDRLARMVDERAPDDIAPYVIPYVDACRGTELLFVGDNSAAIAALRRASESDVGTRAASAGLPHDFVADAGALLAAGLTAAGDDEGARQAIEAARRRAAESSFPVGPFTAATVEIYASYMHRLRGDFEAAIATAQRVSEIGTEHDFGEHVLLGQMLQIAGSAAGGDATACAALEFALQQWQAVGGGLAVPNLYVDLATGALSAGDLEQCRRAVEAADAAMEETGQRAATSEVRRLQALLDHDPRDPSTTIERLTSGLRVAMDNGMARLAARHVVDLATIGAPDDVVASMARLVWDGLPAGADDDLRAMVAVSAG